MKHNPTDSLSLEQITEVLDLFEDGITLSEIAKETGIGLDIVSNIVSMECEDTNGDDVEPDSDDDGLPISESEWFRWNSPRINPD
jgi:hypothetical protein